MTAAGEIILAAATATLQRTHDLAGGGGRMHDPAALKRALAGAVTVGMAACAVGRMGELGEAGTAVRSPRGLEKTARRLFGKDSVFAMPGLVPDAVGRAMVSPLGALGQVDLDATYEFCLAHEFELAADGGLSLQLSKESRNRLGTYYTPASLADACVERAVDRYIEQHLGIAGWSHTPVPRRRRSVVALMMKARAVDLCCGSGRFLVAHIRYLRRHVLTGPDAGAVDPRLLELSANLYGFDVDPIAVELTRTNLAMECGSSEVLAATRERITHGNPLLLTRGATDTARRVRLFHEGHVYHPDLGVESQLLESRWDLVLGNPPWEKVRLEERKFFAPLAPEVTRQTGKDARARAIAALRRTAPGIAAHHLDIQRAMADARSIIRADDRFALSSRGELNSYSLFAELSERVAAPDGVVAVLVKSALCTTAVNGPLFRSWVNAARLVAYWDFINRKKIFHIDSRERFGLLLLGCADPGRIRFAMGLTAHDELTEHRLEELTLSELRRLSPTTGTLPNVSDRDELKLLLSIIRRNVAFDSEYPTAHFGRLVHLTTHASQISRSASPRRVAIHEGKFFERYDGRFAGFAGVGKRARYVGKARAMPITQDAKGRPGTVPESRYFLDRTAWKRISASYAEPWSLMWRNMTSASNAAPCIATILPHCPTIQSVQFLQIPDSPSQELMRLLAVLNSAVFNHMLRCKLNGIDLTQKVVRQVPVPPGARWSAPTVFGTHTDTLGALVDGRVGSLLADDARLRKFLPKGQRPARDRKACMAELDQLVAFAYDLTRGEADRMTASSGTTLPWPVAVSA